MARDLNRVFLIGRLGTEPEMRYTPQGTAVTQFRFAVNRRARQDGAHDVREETDWFTVIGWQKLAEIMAQYLHKGARIYLEGRLQTRSWQDQSGQRRYATEVVASDMIMLDTRQAGGERVEDLDDSSAPF